MPYKNPEDKAAYDRQYRQRPDVKARRRLLRAHPSAKAKARARQLRWRYGLRAHEFDELLRSQGGKCAVCGSAKSGRRDWHVDHDHVSGRVRGLLCSRCNPLLGLAEDDPDVLRKAADYLDETLLRWDRADE